MSRPGALWVLAGALAAAAVTLWLASASGGERRLPTAQAVATPARGAVLRRPQGSHSPRARPVAQDAERAALRFIDGYLAVSYGHASAGAIAGATRAVRERLRFVGAHVSPEVASRDPRVVNLHVDAARPGYKVAVATVDDGALLYAITVVLARRQRGWVVTSVGPS